MRERMRILASGLLLIGAFWTGVGCGNQSRSVQGNIEVAGENTQDTGIVGNGVTNDAGAAAGHSAQAGSTDSSETAEAGVSQNTAAGSTVMVSGGITEQKAKEIATENAGVTEEQIQYITVKQDWDDGQARYEVGFTAAGVEYDYELDASDGRILSTDSEVIGGGYSTGTTDSTANGTADGTADSQNTAGTSQTATGGISMEAARQTVMDKIPGIDAGNIYIHQDYEDGVYVYEGEAYHAEVKYEFEMNAFDGTITSWEAESIYD